MADVNVHDTACGSKSGPFFEDKCYYVYEIIVDGLVKYVGKGRGRRANRHIGMAIAVTKNDKHRYARSKFYRNLGAAIQAGQTVETRFVANGLSSNEALDKEVDQIALYGLKNLWNNSPGGEPGVGSWEAKAKAKYRWKDPESRKAHSERLKAVYSDPDVKERHREAIRRQRPPTAEEVAIWKEKLKARWSRPGEKDRQSQHARRMQADRAAKRYANLHCASLSFGC